jgi:hypothetical protein
MAVIPLEGIEECAPKQPQVCTSNLKFFYHRIFAIQSSELEMVDYPSKRIENIYAPLMNPRIRYLDTKNLLPGWSL